MNIIVLHLIFLTSCLLQFCFVFFLPLFLSVAGSTPESQIIGGRVRSVSHPAGHRIRTISQSGLRYSCSVGSQSENTTHLVVIRALWFADPSTVSIQEAPRSTYMGCAAGNGVDVHSHVFPIMSYSPAGRINIVRQRYERTKRSQQRTSDSLWS